MNNDEDTSGTLQLTLVHRDRIVRAMVTVQEISDSLDKGALLAGVVDHLQGCLKFNIKICDNGSTGAVGQAKLS
jgi:hypothetical protein